MHVVNLLNKLSLIVISVIMFSGCSPKSAKIVKKIPQRYIDRPYTLPTGNNSWTASALQRHTSYTDTAEFAASDEKDFLLNPLGWENPISDNVSVEITPLPGIRYQVLKTDNSWLGARLDTVLFVTMAEIQYHYKLSENIALVPQLNYIDSDFIFATGSQQTAGFNLIYQANDSVAIIAGVERARQEIEDDFFSSFFGSASPEIDIDYLTVVKLGFNYYLNKSWDVSVSWRETTYDEITEDKLQHLVLETRYFY